MRLWFGLVAVSALSSCTCLQVVAECVPTTCAALGATCGAPDDGCGGTLKCGACTSPDACLASPGLGARCVTPTGCVAASCQALDAGCGLVADGCGRTLDCGPCGGCLATSCQAEGKTCGSIPDRCGGTLSCGTCAAPQACGPANVCLCAAPACELPPVLAATSWSPDSVDLDWTDPSSTEAAFALERSEDGGAFLPAASLPADQVQATDRAVAPATAYRYRVRASSAAGPGPWSNVVEVTTLAVASRWPTIGANGQHTGFNEQETGRPPLTLAWSAAAGGGSELQPAVVEGQRVFVSTVGYFLGQRLLALDTATGAILWSHDFGDVFAIGQPAVYGRSVFLAQSNNFGDTRLWSLDAAAGTVNYSVAMDSQWERYWAPVLAGGRLFLNGGTYGGLYGFDASSGRRRFFAGLEQYDRWSPAVDLPGNLFTFVAGNLRQHRPDTGEESWSVTVPWNWVGWSTGTTPVVGGGLVYVIAPPDLHAIDPSAHRVAWSATGFTFTGLPAYREGSVFALSAGSVRVHDAASGGSRWTFVGDGALAFPPVLAGGFLYVSSAANTYAVDLATHQQVWTEAHGGWLSIADGKLFIAAADGTLWAYALTR